MLDDEQVAELQGHEVVDPDGETIGTIEELFLSSADDRPAWAAVQVDGHRALVPLDGATIEGETVQVRYGANVVSGAPDHSGDTLDPEAEEELYAHYGIHDATLRSDTGAPADLDLPAVDPEEQGSSRDPREGGATDAEVGHP